MDAFYRVVASLVMGFMSALGVQPSPATWQMQTIDGRTVALTISDHPHSSHSRTIAVEQFDGLKPLLSESGPARFRLKRDAGVFEFDGVLRGGSGGGTMEFIPSPVFPAELAKRGFGAPTRIEQMKMAWSDTGFAFIDELATLKYERPTLPQLVNASDHGVDSTYIREMSGLGYRLGRVDALIRLHDHGVDAEYIRGLAAVGLKSLGEDDLVRAHDHGIGPEYVGDMRALGYSLTLDELVAAHDHGVTRQYAQDFQKRGSRPVIGQLIQFHDHGLNAGTAPLSASAQSR